MAKIVYTPEGGSRRVWDVDFDNPAWDIHKAATKQLGCGWVTFINRIGDVDAEAWQALIWVLRRRDEPKLEFSSVEFPTGLLNEVEIEDEEEPAQAEESESGEA